MRLGREGADDVGHEIFQQAPLPAAAEWSRGSKAPGFTIGRLAKEGHKSAGDHSISGCLSVQLFESLGLFVADQHHI